MSKPWIFVKQSNLEQLKIWFLNNSQVMQFDENGKSCLYYACLNNNAEIIHFLLELGANIHKIDDKKNNVLHIVRDPQIAKQFTNINLNRMNIDNETPFTLACLEKNFKYAFWLSKPYPILVHELAHVIGKHDVRSLIFCDRLGIDLNIIDQGYTSLDTAVAANNIKNVKFLLCKGFYQETKLEDLSRIKTKLVRDDAKKILYEFYHNQHLKKEWIMEIYPKEELAYELYVIFCCLQDGYYNLIDNQSNQSRFFKICQKLNNDTIQIVFLRLYGLCNTLI